MRKILVTGDICVDHNIYKGGRRYPQDYKLLGSEIRSDIGGFYLLYELLSRFYEDNHEEQVKVVAGIERPKLDEVAAARHGYASWKPFKQKNGLTVWCLDELLGYGAGSPQVKDTLQPANQTTTPDILVIDDAALGFRYKTGLWPQCLKTKKSTSKMTPEWIVLKMSYPIMQGDLWGELTKRFAGRLIILVSAEDLRRSGVHVSRGSSWERTIQDLLHEMRFNPVLRIAESCAHFIVTFKSEGAFILSSAENTDERATFIFDPGYLEGQWQMAQKGGVIGYGTCTAAGVVRGLLLHGAEGLETGVRLGLAATRTLLKHGHGVVEAKAPSVQKGFPTEALCNEALSVTAGSLFNFAEIERRAVLDNKNWTILADWAGEVIQPLYGVAREVAHFGPKVLKSVPVGQYGALLSVERKEIESLNSIRLLIAHYLERDSGKKPLSIGVFGPPGSGKSFGIKQIVKQIMEESTILEYNLSQFEMGPGTLISLLHRVRDVVLKGQVPVVFWDEFDSQQLAWLQYLLAPMQDGCFLDGHIMHPLGKCIFIFAGGTAYTMETFSPDKDEVEEYRAFKQRKGPDFVSRLHGYLNVVGPNQRENEAGEKDPEDIFFPIRRALFLRSMAGISSDKELKIDAGLLSAFLKIDSYEHGARSLETIVKLIPTTSRYGYLRANLPPREQIGVHIDYDKFFHLINRDMEFLQQCDVLAPAIHAYYAEKFPDGTYSKTEFSKLPADIQNSNRAAALRMPQVLDLANLRLVPQSEEDSMTDKKVKEKLKQQLEKLAEAEHNGWMEHKLMNEWRTDERDDERRRHDCLVSYAKLKEEDKEKDRKAVLGYPEIARQAGFTIVFERME